MQDTRRDQVGSVRLEGFSEGHPSGSASPRLPSREARSSALSVGAQQAGAAPSSAAPIIARTIPRTNQPLPIIGLGTFLTFDVIPGQKRDHLREVMRRFLGGGRIDCPGFVSEQLKALPPF